MTRHCAMALAVAASFGLGVGAMRSDLHAQVKPPVYLVTEIALLTDPSTYMKDYASKSQPIIKAAGGKFLAASETVAAFEGERPKRVAITMWDSMEQLQTWWNSPVRKELMPVRDKVAKFRSFALEGTP